ncbi:MULTISPECIES: hypothetical protein [Paenibacillus]|uniref:hypothetical protein n=1 Tax=Paenibacillus TaxID=44249 RepID=UPI0022B8CB5C|nr:hypothetical protein [Paenibacillus caseinilyticus]MCZ8519552.1 hypothetical protein [Paenibacillus caseinilyticus]
MVCTSSERRRGRSCAEMITHIQEAEGGDGGEDHRGKEREEAEAFVEVGLGRGQVGGKVRGERGRTEKIEMVERRKGAQGKGRKGRRSEKSSGGRAYRFHTTLRNR